MAFQIVQESPWQNILCWVCFFLVALLMGIAIFSNWSAKVTIWVMSSVLALAAASALGAFVLDSQQTAENNASFSQQLMDEYHVTSSRSLYDINLDFERFDEARTVFTQDGKETPVFIKLLRKNDKMIIMDFTVIDDKALYPRPSK